MKLARITAITTLLFLALSAIAGAIPLIVDPSGQMIQMPLSLLKHSPFRSFLIPAIVLLVANGLCCLWVLWMAWKKRPGYPLLVVGQGIVLAGWLLVEIILLEVIVNLHYFYGVIALILVLTGMRLRKEQQEHAG
jgi:hypothetical protein